MPDNAADNAPDAYDREMALARTVAALRLLSTLSAEAGRGTLLDIGDLALTLDLIALEAARAEPKL